jgi:hypothetical protein
MNLNLLDMGMLRTNKYLFQCWTMTKDVHVTESVIVSLRGWM